MVAVALGTLAATQIDTRGVADLGLIEVVGPAFFLALVVLTVGFAWTVVHQPGRSGLLTAYVAALVYVLDGVPALAESDPRFPTAWLHAGFVEYIARTGSTLPKLDGRFSWPGAFSLFGLLAKAGGVDSAVSLIRWTPLVVTLLLVVPLRMIFDSVTRDARACWLGIWLFFLVNWVGQDYLSPQAVGFLLFVAFIGIVVRYFGPESSDRIPRRSSARPTRLRDWWVTLGSPGEVPVPTLTSPARRMLVATLIALFGAMVVSHPLTPLFALGGLTALVLTRRCPLRWLPVLLAIMWLGWFWFGAAEFRATHLGSVTAGLGSLGGNANSAIGARFGSNVARTFVLSMRVASVATLAAAAFVGFIRRRRAGHHEWSMALLAIAPVPAIALSSYGGEVALRIFLFSLPFAAILAAMAWLPLPAAVGSGIPRPAAATPGAPSRCSIGALAVTGLVLATVFMLIRYSNERFEQVLPEERHAVQYVYDHARTGDTLVAINAAIPWRDRFLERFDYETFSVPAMARGQTRQLEEFIRAVTRPGARAFFVATPAQAGYDELINGYRHQWLTSLRRGLNRSACFEPAFRERNAFVYRFTCIGRQ